MSLLLFISKNGHHQFHSRLVIDPDKAKTVSSLRTTFTNSSDSVQLQVNFSRMVAIIEKVKKFLFQMASIILIAHCFPSTIKKSPTCALIIFQSILQKGTALAERNQQQQRYDGKLKASFTIKSQHVTNVYFPIPVVIDEWLWKRYYTPESAAPFHIGHIFPAWDHSNKIFRLSFTLISQQAEEPPEQGPHAKGKSGNFHLFFSKFTSNAHAAAESTTKILL